VAQADRMRLVTKVARLYHVRGLRQAEIAGRLRLSQPRVSRLLSEAESHGIVRRFVAVAPGLNNDLEQGLCRAYDLTAAHVVDSTAQDEDELVTDLGHAAAPLVAEALSGPFTVGFTPWSRTLRQMVEAMPPIVPISGHVVEMLGDLGAPALQQDVAHLTQRLATLTGARPAFLRVPGVVATPELREALLRHDVHVQDVLRLLDSLDLALLSVGPCTVVAPLRAGDNYFTDEQFATARRAGAVGQVCLRFLDADGAPVHTPLDDLVVGVTHEQLRRARGRWAVAGGPSKYAVLRAALVGRWVDHLVTDTVTAGHLLETAPA
jgi:DNA-binding transcriptional regulator LsrR (DeoR family)